MLDYFLATIIFQPGIDIAAIDLSGFSPAEFCHDDISDSDQLPEELVIEK